MKVDNLSYITLLHEFCMMHKLPKPEYKTLKVDSGNVTVCVNVGIISRDATEIGELKACQTVSKEMYKFLWHSTGCKDNFGEDASGQLCLYKDPGYVMEVQSAQPPGGSISLGLHLLEPKFYHLALIGQFDQYKRLRAYEALLSTPVLELQVTRAAAALDREVDWITLPDNSGSVPQTIALVQIPYTIPYLTFMGKDNEDVARKVIRHLKTRLLLDQPEIIE